MEEEIKTISFKVDLNEDQYKAFTQALCEYKSQRQIAKLALLQWLRDEGYWEDID